jgi:hypothetical protein
MKAGFLLRIGISADDPYDPEPAESPNVNIAGAFTRIRPALQNPLYSIVP